MRMRIFMIYGASAMLHMHSLCIWQGQIITGCGFRALPMILAFILIKTGKIV